MGQRAGLLLKRNFADGTSSVNLLHSQWAIGKIYPAFFMQEVLRMNYNMDTKLSYGNYGKSMQETGYMSFGELYKNSGIDYHYLINGRGNNIFTSQDKGVRDYNKVDVWDIDTIMDLYNRTDNNNGGMIVEVTETKEKLPNGRVHIEITNIKIGFLLGEEECYKMKSKDGVKEVPFSRIVSAREYMERTGGKCCPKCSIVMFEKFLKTFEIEEIVKENRKEKVA